MKIPSTREANDILRNNRVPCAGLRPATPAVQPQGCCAKACVETPLGKVCHCVAHSPLC